MLQAIPFQIGYKILISIPVKAGIHRKNMDKSLVVEIWAASV